MTRITNKAIARMAGYRLITYHSGRYCWYDVDTPGNTSLHFNTEEEAYKDCVESCGLVKREFGIYGREGGPR
jgi:hypothetical protein